MKTILSKLFLFSAILFTMSSLALANTSHDFTLPTDIDGELPIFVKEIGVYAYTSSQTQGMAQLITGATQSYPNGSPAQGPASVGSTIAVYGILTSTLSVPDAVGQAFVLLRATNTANNSSELLCPPIVLASTVSNTLVIFDPPLIAADGLSVTVSSGRATIFYRYLSTNTADNVRIPLDNSQGHKAHDSGWYGVKASSEAGPGGIAESAGRLGSESLDLHTNEMFVNFISTTATAGGSGTSMSGPVQSRTQLFGWVAGTGSATNYITFKDTYSTGSGSESSNDLIVPIFYNTLTYDTAYQYNIGVLAFRNKVFSFPWPIIARNGLTQRRFAVPAAALDRFRVLVKPAGRLR